MMSAGVNGQAIQVIELADESIFDVAALLCSHQRNQKTLHQYLAREVCSSVFSPP
jgi:hypothetical protein